MILNRIRPKIDPLLRGNQSGFRPGVDSINHQTMFAILAAYGIPQEFSTSSRRCTEKGKVK